MKKDTLINFPKPAESCEDFLLSYARQGARDLLAQALQSEVEELLDHYKDRKNADGSFQLVRNGYLPTRSLQTSFGNVDVRVPRVRDREGSGIKFTSELVPRYLRKSRSMQELLPLLYLKGISTGDFNDALRAIVGDKAQGLSSSTISRLKEGWIDDYDLWRKRDLSKKRYAYFWVDGVYLRARMEDKQCILVVIGADEFGKKELIAIEDGYRESSQSWWELLLDLKNRGLEIGPDLCVGDGALGFWNALSKAYPNAKQQRCWVHKTANILNKLPKNLQARAKDHIHDIWMADTREDANKAFDYFIKAYELKYPKATHCLAKDREELLIFYDFPAEHWHHIRTTNPIESTFATVRLRTGKTRGCLSRKTGLTMVFKMIQSAEKRWLKLRGQNMTAQVIKGVNFKNGIAQCKQTMIAA